MSGSWTSSRRRSRADLAGGRARRAPTVTVTWPSGQYQAGIRWPHHSWRETFQSRMLVIQCSQVFSNRVGQDRRLARARRLERGVGERLRADEPLGLEPRLDDVVAPLAATDDHLVRPARPRGRRAPRASATIPARASYRSRPSNGGARARDARLVVEDRRRREAVATAGLVVVVVVGGRDLHRAGAERRVDDRVGDDRHVALDERDAHAPPDDARHSAGRPGGRRRRCRRGSSRAGSWRR